MVKKVSVFFPAYNEEKNIGGIIRKAADVMDRSGYAYEIGVVDDGSVDATSGAVEDAVKKVDGKARLISHGSNLGYGAAARTSLKEASGDMVCVIDSDGQYELEEIPLLIKKIEEGCDMVVGYRRENRSSLYRIALSKGYNLVFRALFMAGYRDIDCGFRALTKSAACRIELKYGDVPVGAELFVRALENGLVIGQVPITHYYRAAGKSTFKLWKISGTVVRIFLNLIRLRTESSI